MGAGGWAVSLAGARGGGGTITDLSDTQMTLCGKSLEASVDEARFELGLEEWVGFQGAGMGQSKGNEADAQDARGAAGSLVWLGGMHGGGGGDKGSGQNRAEARRRRACIFRRGNQWRCHHHRHRSCALAVGEQGESGGDWEESHALLPVLCPASSHAQTEPPRSQPGTRQAERPLAAHCVPVGSPTFPKS